jgi:hypothetical protein
MKDEQIKEIMALVEQYGSECWNDGALKYEFESDDTTQEDRAAIESALRAVPAIPEPLDCLHINRGSADAEADEYAAEYFSQLAQDKADADLRRGAPQTIGYYVRDALRRYQASPQAPDHTEDVLGMVHTKQAVISGAIFDFAGYLTTRPTATRFGSCEEASPMAELIREWAALRGLSLDGAEVESWQKLIESPQAPQPAPPRKPLFEDLIAQHPGLREELSAMDAQSDWTEQTR